MRKMLMLIIPLFLFLAHNNCYGQEESDSKIKLSNKTFGFQLGTARFQSVRMSLVDFDQELLTSSDDLVPIDMKVNFSYYFIPAIAIRFSSGYGFTKQTHTQELDYGKIDIQNLKTQDSATFSAEGFPAEIALIFKTPFDARAKLFFHVGIGVGYYVYDFQAEGKYLARNSKTLEKIKSEEYFSPQMTLSGGAQFFILGLEMSIDSRVSASLDVTKIGWSWMNLNQDILKQDNDGSQITYESKYGSSRQNYSVKNGFEDLSIALGLNWSL